MNENQILYYTHSQPLSNGKSIIAWILFCSNLNQESDKLSEHQQSLLFWEKLREVPRAFCWAFGVFFNLFN